MRRFTAAAVFSLVMCLAFSTAASALPRASAASDDAGAEVALAEKYAPVVVPRQQSSICDVGEPYRPTRVETVLGNSDVVLRGPDGAAVKQAPTADDLAALPDNGEGYHLDLPGNPLSPGCDYERWFAGTGAASDPAVYARVATDPDHPGTLALQYWFFWVFNDWNDKHEGDWEMVQLLFDAESAQEALRTAPTRVAYAQHEGSEVALWDSNKILRDGNHPAVYPGEGSHAAYYTQSLWFGRSAAAGFGCDNTSAEGVLVRPEVIMLPSEAEAAATPGFGWVTYTGRWGQQAPSVNNGPTGPSTKDQWSAPVEWQNREGRPDAVPIPPLQGPAVQRFCAWTEFGSLLFVDALDSPITITVVFGVLLAIGFGLWRSTRWRPVSSSPLRARRRAGQVVSSSFAVYWRFRRTFLVLSAVQYCGFVISAFAMPWLLASTPSGDLTRVVDDAGIVRQLGALLLVLVIATSVVLVGISASVFAPVLIDRGETLTARRALSAAARGRAVGWSFLIVYFVSAFLALSLIFLPVGGWLMARWALATPAAGVEPLSLRQALKRSTALTRGRRWRTLFLTSALLSIGFGAGPLLGMVLLLATPIGFTLSNLVTGALAALFTSVAMIGLTLEYFDQHERVAESRVELVGS